MKLNKNSYLYAFVEKRIKERPEFFDKNNDFFRTLKTRFVGKKSKK